jgi:putative membrane protein
MQRWLLRLLFNAVGLSVAIGTGLVAGIQTEATQATGVVFYLSLALVFTIVNGLVRPILKLLTCPLILLTLGLFTLVINGVVFWLAGWVGQLFDVGFSVEGFWPAFWGGLVVGVVNMVLTVLFRDEMKSGA